MAANNNQDSGLAGGLARLGGARWHSSVEKRASGSVVGSGLRGGLGCLGSGSVSIPNNTTPVGLRVGSYNVGQGFSGKIEKILVRAAQLDLDMLALSEVGDPHINSRLIGSFGFRFVVCPKEHARVMLLYRSSLAAHLRRQLDTGSAGRLVGAIFELAGVSCLIVSAYMHSGVDRMLAGSEQLRGVSAVYERILRWTGDKRVERSIVLGDLNETVSDVDRSVVLSGSWSRRCIASLLDNDFVDCYRSLHSESGFTCRTPLAERAAWARIDYVLARGFGDVPAQICVVDDFLALSRHSLIWACVGEGSAIPDAAQIIRLRIPNMRRATAAQKAAMARSMGDSLEAHQGWFSKLADGAAVQETSLNFACRTLIHHLWPRIGNVFAHSRTYPRQKLQAGCCVLFLSYTCTVDSAYE